MSKLAINAIIGIDPGSSGGIAVYTGDGVRVVRMPKDVERLRDFFAYYSANYRPIAFLEKLSVRPDDVIMQGERAAMGKLYRIQRMMANFEQLKATIELAGIPYCLVHPGTWQSKLKLRIPGEEKAERKRRYRDMAGEAFPEIKTTLWNADALLIMQFGRWALVNDWDWVRGNLPKREMEKLF